MTKDDQILNDIETDKDDVLVENNAQTIFDHISELERDRANNQKRWFWELLQNAKDSVEDDENVSVKVTLKDNELVFSHTGNPFQRKDILHLIFHGSSKKKAEGKTGRFGTGFMTTHLLSRKVRIKGQLQGGGYFNFLLDRTANDYIEQKDSLDDSYSRFKNSYTTVSPFIDEYKTEFVYDLSDETHDGKTIAENGLQMLPEILPFVLAFNKKIKKIVADNFEMKKEEVTGVQQDSVCINFCGIKSSRNENFKVATFETPDYTLAVLLEKIDDNWQVRKLSEKHPKLFFDFPLFGTEKFGTTFIINSLKFTPRRERDGVHLGENGDDKILLNKRIVESALNDFGKMVSFFGANGTKNAHYLLLISLPSDFTWLDEKWYRVVLNKLVISLIDAKCITVGSDDNRRISTIGDSKIPYSGNESQNELFTIVKVLFPLFVVETSIASQLIDVTNNFSVISGTLIENFDFIITPEKICKLICETSDTEVADLEQNKGKSNLEIFRVKYFNDRSTSDVLNWINSFFKILTEDQLSVYSSNYWITPNQNENFIQRTADRPKIDDNIESQLKDVAEHYGWNIKDELIHKLIDSRKVFQTLNQEKVLDELEKKNRHFSIDNIDDSVRLGFVKHLKWLLNNEEDTRLKQIHVLIADSDNSEGSIVTRSLYIDEGRKLFIPQAFWSEKYSHYGDLVPEKYILHDIYSGNISREEFMLLKDRNLVYSEPLINRKKRATKTDFNLLLKNADDINVLCDDKGELKTYEIEYSDIPYFTHSDILSKTGGSFKATKSLLKFVLFQILPEDVLFDTVGLVDGVTYNRCLWAIRLKNTKWVASKQINEDGTPGKTSSEPSTVNISELIGEEDDIFSNLNSEKTAIFFNTLGISVADIIRSLMTDPAKKLQWDLTFSKLLTNKKIDPALAQEMLEDPLLQEEYLKKKKNRESVERNRNIGYLFEKVFSEIFRKDELKRFGFSIDRKPIGSDFKIQYESEIMDSDITDEKGEVLFKVGSCLIELKATGKDIAEMTPTQGETAVSSENFVLAVLPLSDFEIDEESVKTHTKFIVNIGEVLQPHYASFQSYCVEKATATLDDTNAKLSIEDGQVRYQVKADLWKNSPFNFEKFIEWMVGSANVVSKVITLEDTQS